jgi:hypothetical protein
LFYNILLAMGHSLDNLHTLLSNYEIKKLTLSKELTILESNKRRFAVNEEVVLKLRIKNVKSIIAEVYELNTEKPYLHSQTDIDDTVSLDFIEHLTKVDREIDAINPFKELIVEFSLATIIDNKRSVYIVDFRVDDISSRAFIRRGSIVAMQKMTLAGI